MSKYLANFALSVVVFIVLPIISTLLIMRAVAGVDVRGALIQADEYANITTGGNRNEPWRYDPAMLFAVLVSHGRIVQACDAVKNKTPLLA